MKSFLELLPKENTPKLILKISLQKYNITAINDPKWTATSKTLPWSGLFNKFGKIIKWADDYIGKPFEPKELLLRINNVIDKNNKLDLTKKHYIGKVEVDLNKMIIRVKENEKKTVTSQPYVSGLCSSISWIVLQKPCCRQ